MRSDVSTQSVTARETRSAPPSPPGPVPLVTFLLCTLPRLTVTLRCQLSKVGVSMGPAVHPCAAHPLCSQLQWVSEKPHYSSCFLIFLLFFPSPFIPSMSSSTPPHPHSHHAAVHVPEFSFFAQSLRPPSCLPALSLFLSLSLSRSLCLVVQFVY